MALIFGGTGGNMAVPRCQIFEPVKPFTTFTPNFAAAFALSIIFFAARPRTPSALMAEQGVPLPVVQAMVGHMSEEMVRYYTHISNHAPRQAVELLDEPRRQDSWGNPWGNLAARII